MGRNWRPKYAAVCPKCGWFGKRVAVTNFCPKGCEVRCKPKVEALRDHPLKGGEE